MVLSQAFEKALEDEIEARVQERITKVLEIISKNYNIRYDRLLKDLSQISGSSSSESGSGCCCGLTRTGKRCMKPGRYDGYCKTHVSQKPDVRKRVQATEEPKKVTHTHTIPPLFQPGCPACEESRKLGGVFVT